MFLWCTNSSTHCSRQVFIDTEFEFSIIYYFLFFGISGTFDWKNFYWNRDFKKMLFFFADIVYQLWVKSRAQSQNCALLCHTPSYLIFSLYFPNSKNEVGRRRRRRGITWHGRSHHIFLQVPWWKVSELERSCWTVITLYHVEFAAVWSIQLFLCNASKIYPKVCLCCFLCIRFLLKVQHSLYSN